LDLVVTTVTPTGQAAATRLFEPLAAGGRSVVVTYLPFDLGLLVRRFLDRYAPRALVLFESELWPLLLRDCRRRSIPVGVLNARISDRSYGRMKRAGRLYRRFLLDPLGRLGAQSPQDEERLLSLGARPARTSLTGNLKFDTPEPVPVAGLEKALRNLAAERPILVAGSTMPGEEPIVLDAFEQLDREALLILAPRHPERFDDVWREVEERSLPGMRRSGIPGARAHEPASASPPEIVLLDSLGELASIYRLASVAFIGGTLVPTGGHNPIEAARFGVPVIVGPSMENFRRIARDLEVADGVTLAADGEALTEAWRRFLDHPREATEQGRRGLAIVDRNRGAVERSVELLSELVDLD
ncbi:MAG: 3-deoxy-D-manno-octulosonic acid transferase, partial [Holophagales bacterium]|nr:3-deoxy-D-manno-octulosonic acid transferase [Holophagales bacterium]